MQPAVHCQRNKYETPSQWRDFHINVDNILKIRLFFVLCVPCSQIPRLLQHSQMTLNPWQRQTWTFKNAFRRCCSLSRHQHEHCLITTHHDSKNLCLIKSANTHARFRRFLGFSVSETPSFLLFSQSWLKTLLCWASFSKTPCLNSSASVLKTPEPPFEKPSLSLRFFEFILVFLVVFSVYNRSKE